MATKVKIYTKPINGGMDTIYLDFYPPIKHPDTGKPTRREYLKLFLYSTEQREIDPATKGTAKEKITTKAKLDKDDNPKKATLTTLQKLHNKETLAIAENVRSTRQLEIQAGQFGFLSTAKLNMNFSGIRIISVCLRNSILMHVDDVAFIQIWP